MHKSTIVSDHVKIIVLKDVLVDNIFDVKVVSILKRTKWSQYSGFKANEGK